MQLTSDQIHTITESLRRQRIASRGFAAEMQSLGQSGLVRQFEKQADEADALRVILEDAHVVDVTPFDFDEHATDEEKAAPVVNCW